MRTNPFLAQISRRYDADVPPRRTGLPRPPVSSFGHGAAGVAYFLFRYGSVTGDGRALTTAGDWVAASERGLGSPAAFLGSSRVFPDGRFPLESSLYFGEPGVWCVSALVNAVLGDDAGAGHAVGRFVAIAERCPDDAIDAVLGAASLLLGAAVLVEEMDDPAPADLMSAGGRLATQLVAAVARHDGPGPAPVEWLGAAHGWAGITHALLRWSQATGTAPNPDVAGMLERLGRAEVGYGQWPRREGSAEVWAGWCHGSAGFAQLWTLAWEVLGDDNLLARAQRAAAYAVYEGGGGASLCCGLAGEAYAALALHQATGDRAWLAQARHVAAQARSASVDESFPEHSLWRGDLGVALLTAELEDPMSAAMPLYRRRHA